MRVWFMCIRVCVCVSLVGLYTFFPINFLLSLTNDSVKIKRYKHTHTHTRPNYHIQFLEVVILLLLCFQT